MPTMGASQTLDRAMTDLSLLTLIGVLLVSMATAVIAVLADS
jgi:hypothetical protein